MPKLSPRRRDNPQNGTDVSKSKFKLSSNGFSRKRRTVSADDDVSKSTNLKWKSNLSPRSKSNSENGFDVSKGKFKRAFNDDSRKRKTFSADGNVSKSPKSEWKSKLSPRNKENPQNGTDFSKSKFKRTLNDVSRQRKAVSTADYTSKFSNSKSGKEFNREAPKGKIQFKRQSSETKNSDELDAKTEKNELRTKKREKKSSNEESSEVTLGDRPKRGRKRITMRLDPYDISNKRMDDSIALNETHEEKKTKSIEDSEKVELSMNAQFRAIKPSPSILTFVEHNLLGRRRSIELQRAGYNIDLSAPLDNIPNSTSSERERLEESIFRNKLDFFAAAKVSSSFPPVDAPEIAFAGRSNVGKSSLLNALTRQWGVVRTSDKPGLTQTINFFNLGPKLNLVDLPGYGFAYAKEEVKDAWEDLVKEYVSTRVGLKRVCLLIDTKWGMKPRDQELINLMERSQTNYQIVLTKTDVVFPIDVARRAMQIEETLKKNKSIVQPVMMVSSKSGAGIRSLRTVLAKLARFVKP